VPLFTDIFSAGGCSFWVERKAENAWIGFRALRIPSLQVAILSSMKNAFSETR
jgi:hypothetical protein